VLAEHGGHEVKHTGAGIFARFEAADVALASADEIQRRLRSSGLSAAIGIIGNTLPHEDPLLSPNLFLRAQALTAATEAGATQVEAEVQAALPKPAANTDDEALVSADDAMVA